MRLMLCTRTVMTRACGPTDSQCSAASKKLVYVAKTLPLFVSITKNMAFPSILMTFGSYAWPPCGGRFG